VGDTSNFVFRQKLVGENGSVRRCVVMVKQPGLFSLKLKTMSSHFLAKSSQNFAVEPEIHSLACWDKFFMQSPLDVKESDDHALKIAFHLSGLFFWPWRKRARYLYKKSLPLARRVFRNNSCVLGQ
jgi:hypothetical protein